MKPKGIPIYTAEQLMRKDRTEESFNGQQIDYDALYYQALAIAFNRFIEEERNGKIYTEERLVKSIEAARTLYKNK